MSNVSAYRLARLEQELAAEGEKALDVIADFFSDEETAGFRVVDRSTQDLRLRVGPLAIFFRLAYGLVPNAFIQFGHFVSASDGTVVEDVDGEWTYNATSSLTYSLRQPNGRVLSKALRVVLTAISDKHGESVRIVEGVVQPPAEVTPWEPDVW